MVFFIFFRSYISILTLSCLICAFAPLPCKLYPKILGGNSGNTSFTSLDVNLAKDYLAAGGFTNDYELTNRTSAANI